MPKKKYFSNMESLQPVINVLNEAAEAINDPKRTIKESAIPEVILGALGAGAGGVASFAALYGLGLVGLSAAGITSGLAAAGALVGGGMAAGVFVITAPVAILAAGGAGLAAHLKAKQLSQKKSEIYGTVMRTLDKLKKIMQEESSKERTDYLQGLCILLDRARMDLEHDLF